MSIKINPVKAVCMKYDCKNHGIQGLNTDCFGICAAYSGTFDTFEMDPECTKSCTNLIEQRKREIYGVGSCDHQTPLRPVAWEQVPRYVPQLLKKGYSPQKALDACVDLCSSTSLPEECKETCLLDFNAIEYLEKPKSFKLDTDVPKKETKNYLIIGSILLLIVILILVLLKNKFY